MRSIVQGYRGEKGVCKDKNQRAAGFKAYTWVASLLGSLAVLLRLSLTPGSMRHPVSEDVP